MQNQIHTFASTSAQPFALRASHANPAHHPFGLGIADHEDLVWLTSRATGAVVFTGTACQLLASAALMAGCTPAQRAELLRPFADASTLENPQENNDESILSIGV